MSTLDELQRSVERLNRAVERLKNAARNNDGTLIDEDYGEVFVCVSDLHLANEILSERAELLATVEGMRVALGDWAERIDAQTWRIGTSSLDAVISEMRRAALTTGEANHKDKP